MKPLKSGSKQTELMKFVRVFEEADRPNCITSQKYRTMLAILATNPILSKGIGRHKLL